MGKGEGGRGKGAPQEWHSVAGVIRGARRRDQWSEGAKLPDMDMWDLKQHLELAVEAAAAGCNVQPAGGGQAGWVAVQRGGEVVGEAGPLEADSPVWAAPLFGFEVRLETAVPEVAAYRPLPTQPPVERDGALLLPAGGTGAGGAAGLARAVGAPPGRLGGVAENRGARRAPG